MKKKKRSGERLDEINGKRLSRCPVQESNYRRQFPAKPIQSKGEHVGREREKWLVMMAKRNKKHHLLGKLVQCHEVMWRKTNNKRAKQQTRNVTCRTTKVVWMCTQSIWYVCWRFNLRPNHWKQTYMRKNKNRKQFKCYGKLKRNLVLTSVNVKKTLVAKINNMVVVTIVDEYEWRGERMPMMPMMPRKGEKNMAKQ